MNFYSKKMIFKLIVKLGRLISMSFSALLNSEYFSNIVVKFHHGNFLTFLRTGQFTDIFTPKTNILRSLKNFRYFYA